MKQCVKFPDDKFLAVRPCLIAICLGNRPAGKLLGALLYKYNLLAESKDNAENHNAIRIGKGEQPNQDTSCRIFRTQSQLVDDMCGDASEKTLHDTAIPMLQLLGYLDVEQHMEANVYTIDINRIQEALNLYDIKAKAQPRLEKFLISSLQLEKFLISTNDWNTQLEKFLIDKKNFQSRLENLLIQIRNFSYQNGLKRGRKRAPEAGSAHTPKSPKNNKETFKKNNKNNSNVVGESESSTDTNAASAANTPSPSSQSIDEPTPPTVTETSTVEPVAPTTSEPSKQEENATQQNEQPKKPRTPRPPKVVEENPAPLAMPAPDAKWNAETAVQIVEYSKGRRYSETTRKQELVDAKKILEMAYGDGTITRAQFEDAWKDMASWSFWSQKGIDPMIKHLRKDDKIITILNGLKPKMSNKPQTTQQPPATEQKPAIDYDKIYSNGLKLFTPDQFKRPDSPVKTGK